MHELQQAIDKLGGQVYVDEAGDIAGVVYRADETGLYYAVDLDQIEGLAARLAADESDAYSLWCAGEGYTEGYRSEERAARKAGLIDCVI